MEFRCLSQAGSCTWLKILLVPEKRRREILLCYVVDVGESNREVHLLKQIVDRYVYRNCDYLICLDTQEDAYTLFRRKEGHLFAPEPSGSYSRMVGQCIDSHVASEDKDRVRKETEISHVLRALEKEGEHMVAYGVMDPVKGYQRKRFQYVYYDRTNHIVLLMGTDITREYEEQCRQK